MNEELLPCPFCGGEAVESMGEYGTGKPWPYVECIDCGATTDIGVWNQRLPSHNSKYSAAQKIYDEYLMSEWTSVETFGVWLNKRLNSGKQNSA